MPETPFPVMLFAAGFGTRMGALTKDTPKPMVKVAGRPMIDHALGLIETAQTGRVVANLHYKPDALRSHLEGRNVTCILETPDILDTGGGLRNALPTLGATTVITMNSDAFWAGPNPLPLLMAAWQPEVMDALLMCVPSDRAVGRNGPDDFAADPAGRLQRGSGLVYGGLQIIKTDLMSQMPPGAFSLNRLWDVMLRQDRLFGTSYPGHWCDVGHPEGITLAEDLLAGRHV
ncbi:nucleotidyltransferase family protein [uncultured Sulfitobacter sp.]|uniref:nucleotidyltransferase family protein n=1 Tax=uncultured Sulfitobacter sp. TaxID=191468 RepID=UPI00260B1D5F|nr:nucleotidyltransferase family protein [uncultured Sulfitobacter sp.]